MTPAIEEPVDRIVSILEKSQEFRRVPTPIKIGNVPFDFSAVLFGTGKNPDLVVVIDTIKEDALRTRQKIGGLGRAMDVVGSRRPITAILTGPTPDEAALESISKVCRVLPVGPATAGGGSELLNDWLSVLLPLKLPSQTGSHTDPIGEVRKLLPQTLDQGLVSSVLDAAAQGKVNPVRERLRLRLVTPIKDAEKKLDGYESGAA